MVATLVQSSERDGHIQLVISQASGGSRALQDQGYL
jgi:hypothetical protein